MADPAPYFMMLFAILFALVRREEKVRPSKSWRRHLEAGRERGRGLER